MIYLDTHAVVWLLKGTDWLSLAARRLIDAENVLVSPMVVFELQMLYEKQRVKKGPQHFLDYLGKAIGLRVCDLPFYAIARQAIDETWTRDPFDRLIVAQARANKASLLTVDETIRKHYTKAVN